jgi:hypothetical protein
LQDRPHLTARLGLGRIHQQGADRPVQRQPLPDDPLQVAAVGFRPKSVTRLTSASIPKQTFRPNRSAIKGDTLTLQCGLSAEKEISKV